MKNDPHANEPLDDPLENDEPNELTQSLSEDFGRPDLGEQSETADRHGVDEDEE
jgi:hypothetical protein